MTKYDKELDTRTNEYEEAAKPLQGGDDEANEPAGADDEARDE